MTKHLTTVPLLAALAFPAAAQQTIDVHTHIIVPEYVEVLKAHGAELEETFPLPAWDAEWHIAFMDSAGIRTAVLKANLQRLKQTLASEEDLKPYADKILRENAVQLFETEKDAGNDEMLIRISEIEVYPEYLDEYLAFARNVGAESVRKEPGVICIYPMVQKRDSCQIRILEIYAGQKAYKEHIASEHFQTYKQGTLHMVKSLDLVDMDPMNPEGMDEIFKKMTPHNICEK